MSPVDPLALAELVTRVAVLETQVERIVSDIESEKGTRARVNAEIVGELKQIRLDHRGSDQFQNRAIGGLIVLQIAIPLAIKFLLK